ncbi:MAG: hypothetical protein ACODAJ_14275 [Planctomycetota bacterium]
MTSPLSAYLRLDGALRAFATAASTQSQAHIRPTHSYVATRLVIEGGFRPDEITPHPPLRCEKKRGGPQLLLDESVETKKELTLAGGLKSKDVDVVVCKDALGPVLCVSVKGTGNAFRNLTNRMEEAIGDCTNLHVMYPGIVYGFLHLLRANREGQPGIKANDICITADAQPVAPVLRYHNLLADLAGRTFVRNDLTRYEAIALLLIESLPECAGAVFAGFPLDDSPLRFESFFDSLYRVYDLRYPFRNPKIRRAERLAWDPDSPAFEEIQRAADEDLETVLGYTPRLS